ncbi:MAG TPA: glycosyltransferase, partial [Rhodanobacteraceae bacterium]
MATASLHDCGILTGMDRTSVSVLIVAADSGRSLAECVRCALASSAVGELLLLDNASRDGMPDAVEGEHAGDLRVRVIRHDRNLGFGT